MLNKLQTAYSNHGNTNNASNLIPDITIDNAWVKENIFEAIYLNDDMCGYNIPPYRSLPAKKINLELPHAAPIKLKFNSTTISEKILQILLCKSVRRGTKGLLVPFLPIIKSQIELLVKNNQPISFVLPSLPFKDQSPFGTNAPVDHTDLGEYCLFAQLKRILEAIKDVYAPGAHFSIICDGYIYADIFIDNDTTGAGKYKANCAKIKHAYELYNEVTLLDMNELFYRHPNWRGVEHEIRSCIYNLYKTDPTIKARIDFLAQRFIFYTSIPGVNYDNARDIYSSRKIPGWLWQRLVDAAIKYAAIHLTMRKTDIVKRAFPYSIRCTVHPKAAAQLPLHLTNAKNELLPYNGVAVVSRGHLNNGLSLFQAMRVRRLCDVLAMDDVCAVYTDFASAPFYYEIP